MRYAVCGTVKRSNIGQQVQHRTVDEFFLNVFISYPDKNFFTLIALNFHKKAVKKLDLKKNSKLLL